MQARLPIFCLTGPTAVGKTDIAITLTRFFPFEIISVDSAMVYRGMDIGTAKPSSAILQAIPHRLINICEPNEIYSAAQFRVDALREIAAIQALNKIPLLVGGTMLYFRALQQGLATLPSASLELRKQIEAEGSNQGWPALHAQLQQYDPTTAARLHPNDKQRIQRALEVYLTSGKPLSVWLTEEPLSHFPAMHFIAVAPNNRSDLHLAIETRFHTMLTMGFLEEVKALMQNPLVHPNLPAIRSVGYRQAWSYLSGQLSYEELQEKSIAATRQLAKRQLTWLRHWPAITWFENNTAGIKKIVSFIEKTLAG